MKFPKLLHFMLIGALAVSAVSCKKKTTDDDTTPETNVLTGDVTTNKSLTADKTWTLKGYVYVKSGATLTIPAGTVIKSDVVEKGALIVEPGGKLVAEGTAAKPIVFTSGVSKGQRRAGDWGGIILLGNAPTNRSTPPTIEGGVNRTYGGSNAADNSGVLKFVRIEFAGIAAAPNSEINGLTCGGVGSGTVIENVMVAYGNDDAFEFFGGTVNAKNLIAYACSDDDYDFDFGYTGTITNAISFKHPQVADPADASNGVECDNDGTGTSATPFTHPKLSNFTFVGPNNAANTQANHNFANRWRRACHFTIENSIMIGHQKGGFSIESEGTLTSYLTGTSVFKNNLVYAVSSAFKGADSTATAQITAKALADGNVKLAKAEDAGLTDPFKVGAPNFAPKAGSDAQVKGVGAITGTDWTTGWANWDPNNADY
ncbi:hypothetical protein [Polluticoccus soli]|uniref:hypothetical protein n=1 Tax=Polluticoccus soli TaxID=3034150 RepID=UPI0023E1D6C4|nr:hypothetical protein [Flavipsychrobacter sp. JY13-12]